MFGWLYDQSHVETSKEVVVIIGDLHPKCVFPLKEIDDMI